MSELADEGHLQGGEGEAEAAIKEEDWEIFPFRKTEQEMETLEEEEWGEAVKAWDPQFCASVEEEGPWAYVPE